MVETDVEIDDLLNFGPPGAVEAELRQRINLCATLREQRDRAERTRDAYLLEIRKLAQELSELRTPKKTKASAATSTAR